MIQLANYMFDARINDTSSYIMYGKDSYQSPNPIPKVEKQQKDRRRRCVFCGSLASHEAMFKARDNFYFDKNNNNERGKK